MAAVEGIGGHQFIYIVVGLSCLKSFILDGRFELRVDFLLKTKHFLELMISTEAMSLVGGMAS